MEMQQSVVTCTVLRMVPPRLRRNFKYLKYLKKAQRNQRCALLKSAHKDLILCICDCAVNVLKGNVRLTAKHKKALRRYRAALRALTENRRGVETKRKLLIQKGGFLPFLLAPILSAAGGFLGNILRGRTIDE